MPGNLGAGQGDASVLNAAGGVSRRRSRLAVSEANTERPVERSGDIVPAVLAAQTPLKTPLESMESGTRPPIESEKASGDPVLSKLNLKSPGLRRTGSCRRGCG